MPLPLIGLLPAVAATGARLAVTAGARIAGRLALSFGGALARGAARGAVAGAAAGAAAAGSPATTSEEEQVSSPEVQAQEVQTTPTDIQSVTPSTGGDIGGSLRDSPLSILKSIDQNTRLTAQALARRTDSGEPPRRGFLSENRIAVRGAGGSALLALAPLIYDAIQRSIAPIVNAYESLQNVVQGVANAVQESFQAVGEFFNNISSLLPSAAGPTQQPGGPEAEPRREAERQEQRAGEAQVENIRRGEALAPDSRQNLQEALRSGSINSEARARTFALSQGLREGSSGYNAVMEAFNEYNSGQSQTQGNIAPETPPQAPVAPATRNRTVDARRARVSVEDRQILDSIAAAMNINASQVIGGVFTPTGEVISIIERAGNTRQVPEGIRESIRSTAAAAVNTQENNTNTSTSAATNNESSIQPVEASSAAAARTVERVNQPPPAQQPQPIIVTAPSSQPQEARPSTGTATSSAPPPPGTGNPARPPPTHPGLANEPASPAASR